jgi:tetratricopeptide (TPR) repeat protein
LREANLRGVRGDTPSQVADDLTRAPETRASALLAEKTGDLFELAGKLANAVEAYRLALTLKPTLQQRLRLQLGLARRLTSLGRPSDAIEAYEQFFKQNPKYPDLLGVYQQALPLARQLNQESLIRRYEAEIKYLTPPPPATNAPPSATANPLPAKPR